jgi:glycerophosphoryl diester phosphodiesterase
MSLPPLKEFDFNRYPMICAHRGDTSLGAKENTLDAVRAALDSGAEMIEVDIQFTASGEIVCHHDEIDGIGKYERFENIIAIASGRAYLNIELKGYGAINELPLLPSVFSLVEQFKMQDHVLYSSFRPDYIKSISATVITTIIHPTHELSELYGGDDIVEMLPSELMSMSGAATYAAQLSELTDRRLEDIKKNNIHLSVYTINSKEDFDKALTCGGKAIVTDEPRELVRYRSQKFSS